MRRLECMRAKRDRAVINKFQSLLRSGKDYKTSYMYEAAGECAYLSADRAKTVVTAYYRGLVTDDMVSFYSKDKTIEDFSEQFNLCTREARLMIGYIKKKRL